MNPSLTFSVEELTTDEIWTKTNAQVFNVVCNVPGLGNRAIFIKNKKVFDLGRKNLYGAHKPENLLVTDLDGDNLYELCFTLTHGSGAIRTNVVCYINDLSDNYLFADTSFTVATTVKLEQKNDQEIILKQVTKDNEIKIGNLVLVNENNTKKLSVKK